MSNPESPDSDSPTRAITHLVRDTCLCLHVQRAARALARRFDEVFRPLDLTHGQFSLLMSLNRPEPPRIGSVAELLAMDRTTLTANLKPLQRRRLVNVVVDENDKRSRRLMLTGAGRAVLTKALPLWKEAHAATERLLASNPDDFRATLRALSDSPASQTAEDEGAGAPSPSPANEAKQ